ncbi:hypothetical protein EDB89DRAFT_2072001 [Lactarius sanguifluus]|nr:hypothetical protein EDB89DRAFT_2072001 [Lactarius sanguifluus]
MPFHHATPPLISHATTRNTASATTPLCDPVLTTPARRCHLHLCHLTTTPTAARKHHPPRTGHALALRCSSFAVTSKPTAPTPATSPPLKTPPSQHGRHMHIDAATLPLLRHGCRLHLHLATQWPSRPDRHDPLCRLVTAYDYLSGHHAAAAANSAPLPPPQRPTRTPPQSLGPAPTQCHPLIASTAPPPTQDVNWFPHLDRHATALWSWPLQDPLYLNGVHLFDIQVVLLAEVQHLVQYSLVMGVVDGDGDKDVVHVDNHFSKEDKISEDVVHHGLEC